MGSEIILDAEGVEPSHRWDLYDYLQHYTPRVPKVIRGGEVSPAVVVVMDCMATAGAILLKDYIRDWRRAHFPSNPADQVEVLLGENPKVHIEQRR
ncbi:MAG TPA: hypothetical protein VGG72_28550 [Bryobacteraceae bacterium]|jgi:hypothetical protein